MWTVLSICAAFVWSLVNIIDKTILTKYIRKPIIPVIILGFISVIVSIIVLIFNFVLIPPLYIIICFLIGVLYIIGSLLYFKALKTEEASRIVPLFAMSVIWMTILAAIFLGEIFEFYKYAGIFLIITGVVLISIKRKFKFSSKGFFLMFLSTLVFSVYNILVEYILFELDYWTVFTYSRLTSFIVIIPLFIYYLNDFKKIIKKHKGRAIGLSAGSETLNMAGVILYFAALFFGYATLVEAAASTQYVFVFLLSLLLSIWFPKILKEELQGSTIALKIIAILAIVIGVFVVSV